MEAAAQLIVAKKIQACWREDGTVAPIAATRNSDLAEQDRYIGLERSFYHILISGVPMARWPNGQMARPIEPGFHKIEDSPRARISSQAENRCSKSNVELGYQLLPCQHDGDFALSLFGD